MSRLTDTEKDQLRTLLDKARTGTRAKTNHMTKLADVIKKGPLYPGTPNGITGWSKRKTR